jgi:hypothetical protein
MPEEEKQEQKPVENQKTDREFNFEQIRKQLSSEREEKEKLIQRVAELERSMQQSKVAPDEDEKYDEPYVDERHLNKKLSKFEQKMQQQFEAAAEQKAKQLLDQERKNAFLKNNPDFSQILNPDLIQKFADKYPDMAEQMLELPDGFARQKLLYQNIKALGLNKKEEERSVQKKIEENKKSPYYQSTGLPSPAYSGGGDFSESGQKSAYLKLQELKGRLRL